MQGKASSRWDLRDERAVPKVASSTVEAATSVELSNSSRFRAAVKSRGVPMPATWGEEDAASCGLEMLSCWLLPEDCEVSSSEPKPVWMGGVDAN